MVSPPLILSQLSHSSLQRESERLDFPKWSTLCALTLAKLPTLDTLFVSPGTAFEFTQDAVRAFMHKLEVPLLMIRSDGGRESGSYFRGGNSLDYHRAVSLAVELSLQGRAVLLMEPTNRFTNRLSCNLMMLKPRGLIVEILGPGYDASDLNRGNIPAQIVLEMPNISWDCYQELRRSDISISLHFEQEEKRRVWRLAFLAKNAILPIEGSHIVTPGQEFDELANQWLQSKGYHDLQRNWNPHITLSLLKQWYDSAFTVCQVLAHRQQWKALVMSGSQLEDGRFVWWDVEDGLYKFTL